MTNCRQTQRPIHALILRDHMHYSLTTVQKHVLYIVFSLLRVFLCRHVLLLANEIRCLCVWVCVCNIGACKINASHFFLCSRLAVFLLTTLNGKHFRWKRGCQFNCQHKCLWPISSASIYLRQNADYRVCYHTRIEIMVFAQCRYIQYYSIC